MLNQAESIMHDTEKNLDEFKDSVDASEAGNIRSKIKELRDLVKDEKMTAEEIKAKSGEIQQSSLKVFEVAYKKVGLICIGV